MPIVNGYKIAPDANLRDANLWRADLQGASLRDADLRGADLRDANLWRADLQGASLRGADLRRADLQGASLRRANLQGASLRGADLRGADLRGADLPYFQIPQEGELIVWKTVKGGLVKLKIPTEAKRTASLVGRKCRAEYAIVLALVGDSETGFSRYDTTIVYKAGETVYPDKYDADIRIECSHGIHFFLTREEAENY